MAVPKGNTSKSKRDKRRTHDKLTPVNVVECPRCHAKKIAHRVCLACGYYDNKQILKTPGEKKKAPAAASK
jgi:large subunit ribosomal protein L32